MGSLEGLGEGGLGAGNFPRVSSRWGPSKEPLGRSGARVIDGTTVKWRAGGGGGWKWGSITYYWMPSLSSHATQLAVWWRTLGSGALDECVLRPNPDTGSINSSLSLSLPSSQDNPDTFWHKPKESVHKCAWAQLEIQAGGSPVTGITPGSALPSHHSAADSRERRKYKKERDRESHLDTISLSQGKHLRHSSRHTGLQGSKVIMTNEWPRSPERPREVPLESLSRGTEDTETHSPGQEKKDSRRAGVQDPTCGSSTWRRKAKRALSPHLFHHFSPCQVSPLTRFDKLLLIEPNFKG